MATIDLTASARTVLGKKVKQLRRQGVVPANIYSRNAASHAIQAPAVELRRVLRAAGHTGLVRITIDGDGTPRTALVRGVRRESMTGSLVHVDFQQVSMDVRMNVQIPVILTGHAPISEEEGVIMQNRDSIDVECLPGDIPQHIEVDISGMTAPDSVIHVSDLVLPASVTLLTEPTLVMVSVTAATAEAEEAEEVPTADEVPTAEDGTGEAKSEE